MLFASVQRWIANLHKLASDEQLVLSSSTNARLEVETATTGSQSCVRIF